jgi:hypothetical protein
MYDDEAYARQLQHEMELEQQQQQQQQQQRMRSEQSTTTLPLLMDKDARMAQQLEDEELARRYSEQPSSFLDKLSSSSDTNHSHSHGNGRGNGNGNTIMRSPEEASDSSLAATCTNTSTTIPAKGRCVKTMVTTTATTNNSHRTKTSLL